MFSPLILIKTFEVFESVFICLFPIALVTSITLTGILIYLGAFAFCILFIFKQKRCFTFSSFNYVDLSFLIYIFAFTLCKFLNSGTEAGFHAFFRTCQDYFIFLWVLFFILHKENNQRLVRYSLLLAGLISIVYGVFQFFNLDIFHRQEVIGRLSGFHKNPYSYAGQLIIFFFFFLNNLFSKTKSAINYVLWVVLFIACTFCILNAMERAVILGILFGLVIYLVFHKVGKRELLILLSIVFGAFFLSIFVNKKVFSRLKNLILPAQTQRPNVRFKLWRLAIGIWKRNILFGAGKYPTVYHQTDTTTYVLTHAHNVYLQLLVTSGIIGLAAFLNLFFSILKILFVNLKTSQYANCLVAVIFAYFIEGFFEHFWGDSEVRYLLIYFIGFVLAPILAFKLKRE